MSWREGPSPAEGPLVPDPVIVCIDCGGRAHLISRWDDEDPPRPGDLATYRCSDCADRWDIVLEEPEAG
ncbi:MAG TPA: hypothetical protein VE990_07575 [Acidimicrobiales bacterium]|nr:hypothetical protein [Acidimicrobiales bacterium]